MVNIWVVAFVITISLLVIIIVVAIIDLNQYSQTTYRISRAIENENQCPSSNEGICELQLDLDFLNTQLV